MTDETLNELEIPDGVHDAGMATEVLRAWVADGALHVIFDPETFGTNHGEWGRMLADIAQHISNAVAMNGGSSEEEVLAVITRSFEAGAGVPGTARRGKLTSGVKH